MSNPYFQFKQFTIWHNRCAMKVGTDGVLLGAWASIEEAKRVLDVGTGTGLIALMVAQRSNAHITALDVDQEAVAQAKENIALSPWRDRIVVQQADFNSYSSATKFDHIISNPPFFVDSLKGPDDVRNSARHNSSLTYDVLLKQVAALLTCEGVFSIVIPTDVAEKVKRIAAENLLYAAQQLLVVTKPGGETKRVLIAFTFKEQLCKTEELLTEIGRHQYSSEYIALTKDYYINM